jgi:hypothetical protein
MIPGIATSVAVQNGLSVHVTVTDVDSKPVAALEVVPFWIGHRGSIQAHGVPMMIGQ